MTACCRQNHCLAYPRTADKGGPDCPCCYDAPSVCTSSNGVWVPVGAVNDRLGDCLDGRLLGYHSRTGGILTAGDVRKTTRQADWAWQRSPSVTLMVVLGDSMASRADGIGEFAYRGPAVYRIGLPGGGQVRSIVPSGYQGFGVGFDIPFHDGTPALRQDDEIGERLRHLMASNGVFCSGMTKEMMSVAEGIRHLPFSGRMRDLYLEARSIDMLLALVSTGFDDDDLARLEILSPRDRKKLDTAHDILCTRLADPPGLEELAREIGLNTRKLKSGFRSVFGTTVFGFVLAERMRHAYNLLKAGESIQSVAYAVGYGSPKNFATAFRRTFGIVPSSLSRDADPCPECFQSRVLETEPNADLVPNYSRAFSQTP